MKCINCGNENNENVKFCIYCGADISSIKENTNLYNHEINKSSMNKSFNDLTYYKTQEHLKGVAKEKQELENLKLRKLILNKIETIIIRDTKGLDTNQLLIYYFDSKSEIILEILRFVKDFEETVYYYDGTLKGKAKPFENLDFEYLSALIDNLLYYYLKTFVNEERERQKEIDYNKRLKDKQEKDRQEKLFKKMYQSLVYNARLSGFIYAKENSKKILSGYNLNDIDNLTAYNKAVSLFKKTYQEEIKKEIEREKAKKRNLKAFTYRVPRKKGLGLLGVIAFIGGMLDGASKTKWK